MNTKTKPSPKHSPLPWQLTTQDKLGPIWPIITSRNGAVAMVDTSLFGDCLSLPEATANAALIVKAVNHHEELVEALREAEERLDLALIRMEDLALASPDNETMTDRCAVTMRVARDRARTVLVKLEAE